MGNASSHAGAQHFCKILIESGLDNEGTRGLVVGFGEGHEANYLQRQTKAKITGIDIHSRIPKGEKVIFSPILASAMNLPFPDESFDFVFYHHVLEHVPNPKATLVEVKKILIPGGALYLGTPNRHRIIGYVGAYKISTWRKIRNNLMDYKNRLMGTFRNEKGAHAGFSKSELMEMLVPDFVDLNWLTEEYLIYKYKTRLPGRILNLLSKPLVLEVAAPSIYVFCRKAF